MRTSRNSGTVTAVCRKADPGLPKLVVETINLVEDYGIEGDYHAGKLVRHRYLSEKDPDMPNNRQVLLVDTSILAALAGKGIHLEPGMLGENILIQGISVMNLLPCSLLEVGEALLEISEIRKPCHQLNEMHPALLKAVVSNVDGKVRFQAGMLARILRGGRVQPGDLAAEL